MPSRPRLLQGASRFGNGRARAANPRRPEVEPLEGRQLLAVRLQFCYNLDDGLFADPERRRVLETTLNALVGRLGDSLPAVPEMTYVLPVPTSRGVVQFSTSVSADTIPIYVYGTPIADGANGERISARGGAQYSLPMMRTGRNDDYAPNVAYLAFDSDGSTKWHFGATTAGLDRDESDFVTAAQHEFLHAMGFMGNPSFNRFVQNGQFTGPHAMAANGNRPIPLSGSHVAPSIPSVVNPTWTTGQRAYIGPLELGMLEDIGWQVGGPLALDDGKVGSPPVRRFVRDWTLFDHGQGSHLGTTNSGFTQVRVHPWRGVYLMKVDALAGDLLGVETTDFPGPGAAVRTSLKLFDVNGNLLVSADGNSTNFNKASFQYRFSAGGTYYVGAGLYEQRGFTFTSPTYSVPYSEPFFVRATLFGAEDVDSNTPTPSGRPLVPGYMPYNATLPEHDVDFYTLNATAGQRYSVRTSLPPRGGLAGHRIEVTIYDPSGNRVAASGTKSQYGSAPFIARSSGRYSVMVADYPGPSRTSQIVPPLGSSYSVASTTGEYSSFGNRTAGSDYSVSVVTLPPLTDDYNGNGKSNPAVLNPDGYWGVAWSTPLIGFGQPGDIPLAGDFDGDLLADKAFYRPSTATFWIIRSSTGQGSTQKLGWAGVDLPAVADYDGDGKTDLAVYSPVYGYIAAARSSAGATVQMLNVVNGTPVPGDYDGDRKADFAVFDPKTAIWTIHRSSSGSVRTYQLGAGSAYVRDPDVPIPADYNGDGITDLAVFRQFRAEWFVHNLDANGSILKRSATQFGADIIWLPPGSRPDVPVPGDYDGDGLTDLAVYRSATGQYLARLSDGGTYLDPATGRPPVPSMTLWWGALPVQSPLGYKVSRGARLHLG